MRCCVVCSSVCSVDGRVSVSAESRGAAPDKREDRDTRLPSRLPSTHNAGGRRQERAFPISSPAVGLHRTEKLAEAKSAPL